MKTTFIILAVLLSANLFGQSLPVGKPTENGFSPERLARIDALVNEHVEKKWVNGAVVLIVRNGKVIHHKAYGYSDAEKKAAMKSLQANSATCCFR